MEKTYRVKVEGVTPLIMHSSQGANPMNPYTMEKKPIMAKRANKTEADHAKLAELDFLSSLYWSESLNGLFMPTENITKMLLEAGRGLDQKKTKKQIVGVMFLEPIGFPLIAKDRDNLKALAEDPKNKYFKIVTVQKSKTPSTKAIFHEWSFECEFTIDDNIVDPSTVEDWWNYAGTRIGLGGRRPYGPTPGQFGRFEVKSFAEV